VSRYLVRDLAADRTVEVSAAGALHDLLTAWFATADLEQLAAVDELCLAVESGERRADLQVRLGVEVDEIGP
jgi:hypothetical protein